MHIANSKIKEIIKSRKIAILGTGTEIGKTFVTLLLIQFFKKLDVKTVGIKPLATGSKFIKNTLCNNDALSLQKISSINLDYSVINPIVFQQEIAPHIASIKNNYELNIENLVQKTTDVINNKDIELIFIEGVGGILTPLNFYQTWIDYIKTMNIPIILVVGIHLGCLNYALLTDKYIKQNNLPIIGWIANCICHDMKFVKDNISTLIKMLNADYLTTIKFQSI